MTVIIGLTDSDGFTGRVMRNEFGVASIYMSVFSLMRRDGAYEAIANLLDRQWLHLDPMQHEIDGVTAQVYAGDGTPEKQSSLRWNTFGDLDLLVVPAYGLAVIPDGNDSSIGFVGGSLETEEYELQTWSLPIRSRAIKQTISIADRDASTQECGDAPILALTYGEQNGSALTIFEPNRHHVTGHREWTTAFSTPLNAHRSVAASIPLRLENQGYA